MSRHFATIANEATVIGDEALPAKKTAAEKPPFHSLASRLR